MIHLTLFRPSSIRAESPNNHTPGFLTYADNAVRHHALCSKFIVLRVSLVSKNAQEESDESKSH